MGDGVIDPLLQEFLEESREHLARFELDLVALESKPDDPELLRSAYRALHTIKGNCGFLAVPRLEMLAHSAESILARLRDGAIQLNAPTATLLLRAVDALRYQIEFLSREGAEEKGADIELIAALESNGPIAKVTVAAPPVETNARTVRVDVDVLDELMNLVGELVLMRNRAAPAQAAPSPAGSRELDRLTTQLQDTVMRARMEPIGRLFDRIPRLTRDLAAELNKKVRVVTSGGETEVDRSIIESITDPLTHLLRNAIDHGLESPGGTVHIAAFQSGSQVVLEIRDDGRGMDRAALRERAREIGHPRWNDEGFNALEFAFEPGLSTAAMVSHVSGRGVGMDIVRENVERLGGAIELESEPNEGTTVRIRLPLTLAITPGIIVECGDQQFVIPQRHLRELVRVRGRSSLEYVHNCPVHRLRDRLIPVVLLDEQLALRANEKNGATLAVLESEGRRFGLLVDRVLDTQEVVVKPLGPPLRDLPYYGGATTLGTGEVALILEVGGLAARAGVRPTSEPLPGNEADAPEEAPRVLLAEDLAGRRVVLPLDRVERIEEMDASSIREVAGKPVAPWRGGVLPLRMDGTIEQERVTVAVLREPRIGIVLARIEDIVDAPARRDGGMQVIRGEVAEIYEL